MIVKNEELALPHCLNSVRSVVDEMIVLDTGSSDRTVTIARELGATVYSFDWCNDFSAARNQSLTYAQGDWVLVLDADEVLTADIVPALKHAIQNPDLLVVNLVRHEVGATQSPYSLVSRLFRRHPQIRFTRPYHAMVDESVEALLNREPHWQIGYLPNVALLHEGYQAAAIAAQNKFARARTTMEGFWAEHPDDAYVCSKLGALYVESGELTRGIALLERGLAALQAGADSTSRSALGTAPMLYELHYHLGIAYSRQVDLAQSALHYQQAIAQPILPGLKLGAYNNLGNLLKETGNLADARAIYEQVLEIDPTFAIGHYNLGMTLKAMGNFTGAIAAYQRALELTPDYADAHQNLGVVLLKLGRVPESLAAFEQAIALHQQTNPAEAQRLRQGLQAMGFTL